MRRSLVKLLMGLPALGVVAVQSAPKQKILIKSAWGSVGHEVQIFLLGEAVGLMRTVVANAIVPVGWPPLSEAIATAIKSKVRTHV